MGDDAIGVVDAVLNLVVERHASLTRGDGPPRILIVDDEPDILKILAEALTNLAGAHEKPLDELRSDIEEELKKLDKPVLVFIDDIDRLIVGLRELTSMSRGDNV